MFKGVHSKCQLKQLYIAYSTFLQRSLNFIDALPHDHRIPEQVGACSKTAMRFSKLADRKLIIAFDFIRRVNQYQRATIWWRQQSLQTLEAVFLDDLNALI